MAATVWDPQYAGMESGESFQRSWAADREGICLGNEKHPNCLGRTFENTCAEVKNKNLVCAKK